MSRPAPRAAGSPPRRPAARPARSTAGWRARRAPSPRHPRWAVRPSSSWAPSSESASPSRSTRGWSSSTRTSRSRAALVSPASHPSSMRSPSAHRSSSPGRAARRSARMRRVATRKSCSGSEPRPRRTAGSATSIARTCAASIAATRASTDAFAVMGIPASAVRSSTRNTFGRSSPTTAPARRRVFAEPAHVAVVAGRQELDLDLVEPSPDHGLIVDRDHVVEDVRDGDVVAEDPPAQAARAERGDGAERGAPRRCAARSSKASGGGSVPRPASSISNRPPSAGSFNCQRTLRARVRRRRVIPAAARRWSGVSWYAETSVTVRRRSPGSSGRRNPSATSSLRSRSSS